MEPFFVEVMRSWSFAHLGEERRLVADRARHAAEERETSEPACVKRKMLSMNRSTSLFSASRSTRRP